MLQQDDVLPVSPRPIPSPQPMKTMDVLLSHAILRVLVTERKRLVEENEAHQNAREEDEKEDKKEVSCLWGGILLSLLEVKLLLQVLSKELLCLVLKRSESPHQEKEEEKRTHCLTNC